MYQKVNGVRLYFDVEGAALVPDGERMRARPTLILLHGGPGADHTLYKPRFSELTDVAQVVYLDHRANGRSDSGPVESWNLTQWADDLHAFCAELSIEKPVVLGMSFGGFVAQAFATRYPETPGKLILISTAAKFEFPKVFEAFGRIGGAEARQVAENYWLNPTTETRDAYARVCLPFYTVSGMDPDWLSRTIRRDDVAIHFNGPHNEQGRMDFRDALARVTCPTLVMAGERDPITPIVFSEEIVSRLTGCQPIFERFSASGHGIVGDETERATRVIRDFIES
ncbi:MAG: alpha/beta hydrolase [Pseudomonadota bacterium]